MEYGGADVNVVANSGYTPLHYASLSGNVDTPKVNTISLPFSYVPRSDTVSPWRVKVEDEEIKMAKNPAGLHMSLEFFLFRTDSKHPC